MSRITPALVLLLGALAGPAAAFDAQREAVNFAHIDQRRAVEQSDPGWYAQVMSNGVADTVDILTRDATSGGDRFSGSLCGAGLLTCAGDPRTRDWKGGVAKPILYRNRNGAHIEGHLWVGNAYRSATALPGIVIETGSVQAPERWYDWAAEVLATHGYEVMTFDVQGQGRSDMFGSHDPGHFAKGFPPQDTTHFVEDLEDAIGFFEKTAHPSSLGIAGHSLGATAVSIVQAQDPRVDAAVAWDNVDDTVRPRVPMLGMSADYGLAPTPKAGDPDPGAKSTGFANWRAAGVDAMQVNLRGATHYEWSYAPMMLPASLRGIDAAAWYTTAWFDKYLKGDPTADDRLLSDRWRADPIDKGLDASEGGDLYSFYYRSPLALHLADGTTFACADARAASCPLRHDTGPLYSYLGDRG